MSKIKIRLNIREDAWNWWDGCNSDSINFDWKSQIKPALRSKITGKTEKEALKFLLPYLKKLYSDLEIEKHIQKTQSGFDKKQDQIFERMEKVTNRPIYRKAFTCFITSFPRFPYDYEKGCIWISHKRDLDFQVAIFIHELLHFQYFEYFGEKVWDKLGKEKHGRLKEAMTVILNDEFRDITPLSDDGYEIDKELRKKLLPLWRKSENMDEFIDLAVDLMK